MRRLLSISWLGLAALLLSPNVCLSAGENSIESKFATIHYSHDQEIHQFLWRITGLRVTLADSADLVKDRVDELVRRVEELLEMYPTPLHFAIEFQARRSEGPIAEYSHRTRSIVVSLNSVTDGVLAHEIAHAVMNAYFPVSPPEKTQEILAQYVDAHLWN